MIYQTSVTIAANTPATSPSSESFIAAPGTVERVYIIFPDGCAGLVGARIVVRERVIWPTNPDAWFVNNDFTFSFRGNLEIAPPGETFRIEAYNGDQVYQHTVFLSFEVNRPEADRLLSLLSGRPVLASGSGVDYD